MKEKKLKKIIKEKTREVAEFGKLLNNDFDKEFIHKFRVEVKSLRSFLRLLRMHTQESKLKLPGKFKRIYHIAGAIRDAQLEIDCIAEKKWPLPASTQKLQHIIRNQKKEWKKRYDKKIFRNLESRLLACDLNDLSPEQLQDFFRDRMKTIEAIISTGSPAEDQVHMIRKLAKDIPIHLKNRRRKMESCSHTGKGDPNG